MKEQLEKIIEDISCDVKSIETYLLQRKKDLVFLKNESRKLKITFEILSEHRIILNGLERTTLEKDFEENERLIKETTKDIKELSNKERCEKQLLRWMIKYKETKEL